MTTLVTGASGNVGSEVVRLLAMRGQPVRAALREPSLVPPPHGVEQVAFDFADQATFAPALKGVDRIFLMRPPAISDTRRVINPFIDAARKAGVERIVLLSLQGAEHNPVVPHYQLEQYLQANTFDWTFLRAGFFMQNLSTTHRDEIRTLNEIIVPAGQGRTSFIDVRDIAAVAALTLSEEGHSRQAYTLTGATALSYSEVADLLSAYLGRRIAYQRPSILRFFRYWHAKGATSDYILVMLGIYTTARLGLAAGIATDLPRLLGRPPTTMAQFIIDHRDLWYAPSQVLNAVGSR
jgi:uncharacterized protein YbjT (DUF2867 family)